MKIQIKWIQFYIIIIAFIKEDLYSHCAPLQQSSEQFKSLYRSQYMQKIDAQSNSIMNVIKVARQANLIFIGSGVGGITIIDPSKSHSIVYSSPSLLGSIDQDFDVNQEGNQLYTFNSTGFSVYTYKTQQNAMSLFYHDPYQINIDLIAIIYSSMNRKVYLGFKDGSLRVYNVNSMSVSFFTQISLQINTLNGFQISTDGKYIITGNYGDGNIIFRQLFTSTTIQLIKYYQNSSILSFRVLLNDENTVLFSWNYWIGLSVFILDNVLEQIEKDQTQFNLPVSKQGVINYWWVNSENMSQSFVIKLSQDNSHLYLGARSYGYYVIDVKDPSNIKIIYNIPQEGYAQSIGFTSDEKFLYTSNQESVFVFKLESANYNNQYLNFYNPHRSINGFIYTPSAKFYGYIDPDEQFIVVTLELLGLVMLEIKKNPQRLEIIKIFGLGIIDNVSVLGKTNTLVFPSDLNNELVRVYDITDFKNPTLLQTIISNEGSMFRTGQVNTRNDDYIFVEDKKTIVVIDCKQRGNFYIRKVYDVSKQALDQFCALWTTQDDKYLIAGICQIGIFVWDIQDVDNMQYIANYPLRQSMFFQEDTLAKTNHLYVSNGLEGFLLFDLNDLPQFKLLAKVSAKGYVSRVISGRNEQFSIATTFDLGSLSLFDMEDKSNPLLISRFIYGQETANQAFIQKAYDYIYILGLTEIRILPLFSTSLIHSEISEIQHYQTNLQSYRMMNQDEIFYVGQYIQFKYQLIYPQKGQKITGIFYLQNSNLLQLPFWIQFDYYNYQMIVNVVKEALGDSESSSSQIQLKTILLQTSFPIDQSAFVSDEYNIDAALSLEIWNQLSQQNIIGEKNYIKYVFRREQQLYIFLKNSSNQLTSDQVEYVKYILSESTQFNPVYFKISDSLIFDLKQIDQIIQTNSTSVNLIINLDEKFGQLVQKLQNSDTVVFSINTARSQMKISGLPKNVNVFLADKLEIFLYNNTDPSSVQMEIQIDDSINFMMINHYFLHELSFFKIRKRLEVALPLQIQIAQQYENSDLWIESDTQISFSQQTFKNCNFNELTLKAEVKKSLNSEYTELLPTYWLQFQPLSFRMTGIAPSSLFLKDICFRITADDSYSQITDEFCVELSKIPFIYAMNMIIQIVGPLAFFFSFFKFKHVFYNMFVPRFNIYSQELAEEGQLYFKKIPIIGNYLEISQLFFIQFLQQKKLLINEQPFTISQKLKFYFLSKLKKLQYKSSDEYYKWELSWKLGEGKQSYDFLKIYETWFSSTEYTNSNLLYHKSISQIYQNNGRITYQGKSIPITDYFSELNDLTSLMANCFKSLICFQILKQDFRSQSLYKYIKNYIRSKNKNQDWYLEVIQIQSIDERNKYGQQIVLPKATIKQRQLELIVDQVESILKSSSNISKNLPNKYCDVNMHLIANALQFDALGLKPQENIFSLSSKGESLHIQEQQLQLIETFKIFQHSRISKVRKFLNLDYVKLTSHLNNKLPNWMKYEYQKSLVIIQGTPSLNETSDILLRFYDTRGYIIKQYKIVIVHKKKVLEPDYLDEFNHDDQHVDWALNTKEYIDNQQQISSQIIKEDQMRIKNNSISTLNETKLMKLQRTCSLSQQASPLSSSQLLQSLQKNNLRSLFSKQKNGSDPVQILENSNEDNQSIKINMNRTSVIYNQDNYLSD